MSRADESMPDTTRLAVSWRDRGIHPDADCVIAGDTGRPARNSHHVYTYGIPFGTFPTVTKAKAAVESIYGPLPWRQLPGDKTPHPDPVHGTTTEFNQSKRYHVVDHLPELGRATATLTTSGGRGYGEHRGHYDPDDEAPHSGRAPSGTRRDDRAVQGVVRGASQDLITLGPDEVEDLGRSHGEHTESWLRIHSSGTTVSSRFRVEASWRDVVAKAKRIRANGWIQVIAAKPDHIVAQLRV